jgi:hypothetical protein
MNRIANVLVSFTEVKVQGNINEINNYFNNSSLMQVQIYHG